MTKSAASPPPLRLNLLGRFRVERDGRAVRLPTHESRLLLAYLALNLEPHPREKLATVFWPDVPDASARASLRNAMSVLRRTVDSGILVADRETAQLNPELLLRVDAVEFRSRATRYLESTDGGPPGFGPPEYAGDLLVDCYEDWVAAERRALRELYLRVLQESTQRLRSSSEYERAIECARLVLAADPGNERAHQHLMFCHAARGDRAAALRQYEACRRELSEELAVEPSPETERLHDWIRQAPAERMAVEAAVTNLPIPPSAFVGRRQEMAALKSRLASARLLTLTGAGGSGKTRLAIQVATDLLDDFPDGVWWVELGAVTDAEAVAGTIAKVLAVPEVPDQPTSDTVGNFLRPRELLLVLDNCEHLVTACARVVSDLMHQCSRLKVLATSREQLNVPGEQVSPVPALPVPDEDESPNPEGLMTCEAVDLFVRRAAAANPDFSLDPGNAAAVARICRRLDGLPLALELAAARASMLSAGEISARLDRAFELLKGSGHAAPHHHQTLHATMDWSFELLSDKERILLRRLSVFAGGWTLPAAEAVCTGEGIDASGIVDLLSGLVRKSLVEARARESGTRFRLLETIRQYADEKLLESGETTALHARHLLYYLELLEDADPHLGFMLPDAEMDHWLRVLEPEQANLHAAARWCVHSEGVTSAERPALVERGLRLLALQHAFWFARGRFAEGRALLGQLLDAGAEVPAETRALASLTSGFVACWQGDFAAGRAPLSEALELFRRLHAPSGIAMATHGLGYSAVGQGDAALGRSLFEESLRLAREADDPWLTSFALHFLAIVLTYQGAYGPASAHFEEGNALVESLGGHRQATAFSLFHLGRISFLQGDLGTARSRHAESLALFREAGDRRGIGYALAGIAVLAAAEGNGERAMCLAGAVASVEALLGPFLEEPLKMELDQVLAGLRKTAGEEALDAAAAEGRAMSMEEAIDYALES